MYVYASFADNTPHVKKLVSLFILSPLADWQCRMTSIKVKTSRSVWALGFTP